MAKGKEKRITPSFADVEAHEGIHLGLPPSQMV
jgi:hypothetical protein